MEVKNSTTNRGLEGLSAQLTIWTGKMLKKVFKKIDENQLRDLHEDPKQTQTINQSCSSGKSRCFFHILTLAPTLVLPLQRRKSIEFAVVLHPPSYSVVVALADCCLFAFLKNHPKEIYFTYYEETVSRTTWKTVYRRVRRTCSALAALCRINKKLHGKMRHRYEVHILCYTLHVVPFWYLVWMQNYTYGDTTFRMSYILYILHCCWII
jgi:hypothetical protein